MLPVMNERIKDVYSKMVAVLLLLFALSSWPSVCAQFNPALHNPLLSGGPPVPQQAILASVLRNNASLSSCKPTGQISDARCDYETVEMDINSENFFPILDNLRRETYFRLYKVDLYRDCPFWNDNSLCMSRDCTVSKMDEASIPPEYRSASLSSVTTTDIDENTQVPAHEHADHIGMSNTCQCAETDFCHWEDEDWSPESTWVDLMDNPEKFTGYSGTSAHKVWRSIYEENCFGVARTIGAIPSEQAAKQGRTGAQRDLSQSVAAEALSSLLSGSSQPLDTSSSENEQCLEKRVFYKLISGLHASISTHICHDYLDQLTGEWSPNLSCFVERIAQHPERLQNLYFTHAVLVRSLAKLGERLGMSSGDRPSDAHNLLRLAPGLPNPSTPATINLASLLQQAINTPPTFDEESMFHSSNQESEYLRTEFRDRFRNVSRIMDCVGCDKCRLWGKLQTNGLGTALKILFEGNQLLPQRLLQRSELVAIINTVHRISESIRAVEVFRNLYQDEVRKHHHEEEQLRLQRQKIQQRTKDAQRNRPKPLANQTQTQTTNHITTISIPQSIWNQAKILLQKSKQFCEEQWDHCVAWFASALGTVNRSQSSPAKQEL